jgi:PhzF family phenazine biosynthesis protein
MTKTIYIVDAFTDKPFKGNSAGVCILQEKTEDQWMQHIAAELNLSETAFILQQGMGFSIRYFTPTTEVPLCGHATLAAAHILYETKIAAPGSTIAFHSKKGLLEIKQKDNLIVMNFPVYTINETPEPLGFFDIFQTKCHEFYHSPIDETMGWITAVFENEDIIAKLTPNFDLMKQLNFQPVIVTAKSDKPGIDFVLRCFVPSHGINEDPVTGSAHCVLTPLWQQKLNKNQLVSFQLSKRTGIIYSHFLGKRIEINGTAITVIKGITCN